MKMYSNAVVTKDDLNQIDEKQSRQIMQLRVALAVAFIVNAALTGLCYFGMFH